MSFEQQFTALYERLDEVETILIAKMSRHAFLEAKFKPQYLQKQAVYLADKKNGFDSKILAEADLTIDPDYAEYISIPIHVDSLKQQLKILELKVDALSKKMQALKIGR